jgi:poly(A) polymerase
MESSFTALDSYFGLPRAPLLFTRFDGDLVGLARTQENLSFPGLPYADAILETVEPRVRFQCSDGETVCAYTQLRLTHVPGKPWYNGRGGVYEVLRDPKPRPGAAPAESLIFETAVLASRYPYEPDAGPLPGPPRGLPMEYQRDLLELVITGPRPDRGFEILRESGFLAAYWPEVDSLHGVDHAKDFHPEGDAWRHTLETFSHRKAPDLLLSLALLLHDTGKPDAVSSEGRRFDRHSELGERTARSFLSRLGYSQELIRQVAFMVRYHMLPAALPRLPPSSVDHILGDPSFPILLELYRCDELSTFKGPEGYYEACAVYRTWRKNTGNPYRDRDGRKQTRKLNPGER